MERIPPSERISKEITHLVSKLQANGKNKETLGKVLELGMRKIVQELLEAEADEHLERGYYERRGEETKDGYRNGYKEGKIKTGEGKLVIQRPQIREGEEKFKSDLWWHLKGNTEQLEGLAVEMYARGCSTRDVEEVLRDEDGNLLLSRSTISKLSEKLWEEYEEFCKQDLSQHEVVYLFADAVYESMRMYKTVKEGILVVWAILEDGPKVLLGMKLGNKESYEDWLEFFRDLRKRGLKDPVLGTTDGAPGLIRAFEECFSKSLRQRCLAHRKRNILGKVPQDVCSEIKLHLNAVYYAPDLESGKAQAEIFINRFGAKYPSAVKCFKEDLDACLNHLRCPIGHRKSITSTNLLERAFGEEKRRSKVLPRFFDEKSCLKLAFATLFRASQKWHRVRMGYKEQLQIMNLRYELGQISRIDDSSKIRERELVEQKL